MPIWKISTISLTLSSLLLCTIGCDVETYEVVPTEDLQFRATNTLANFNGISYLTHPKAADADALVANCTLELWVHSPSGTVVLSPDVQKLDVYHELTNTYFDELWLSADLITEGFAFFDSRGISRPEPPVGGELMSLTIFVSGKTNYPTAPAQRWSASVIATHDVGGPYLDWQSVAWDGYLEVVSDCGG
jgi:hypothetical protein